MTNDTTGIPQQEPLSEEDFEALRDHVLSYEAGGRAGNGAGGQDFQWRAHPGPTPTPIPLKLHRHHDHTSHTLPGNYVCSYCRPQRVQEPPVAGRTVGNDTKSE